MTTLTRLYVVAATDTGNERLIRAENKAKAVAQASIARIATQSDLERLFAVGVIPEAAEGLDPLAIADLASVAVKGRPKAVRAKPPRAQRRA